MSDTTFSNMDTATLEAFLAAQQNPEELAELIANRKAEAQALQLKLEAERAEREANKLSNRFKKAVKNAKDSIPTVKIVVEKNETPAEEN